VAKLAIITGYLGQTKDRFHFYNEDIDLEAKFRMMTEIEGYDGVEIVHPYEVLDVKETRALLAKYRLRISAINCNIKADPAFRNGGVTVADKAVRDRAVGFIKKAKDYAEEIGADKVTCCPLADGYEFVFQHDYARAWKHLVECFGEAGSYKKNIPLFIEYKPSETRGHCFVDSAAKTLLLLKDIGITEMGVTLDFGHSVYGIENPAEAVALLAESPFRYYIHINDNDGRWDWDYFCGTKHYLEYVEFLFYLKRYGYDDYMTSDTSPTRWDVRKTFEANSRITNKIWKALDGIDAKKMERLIASGDYLDTWKLVEETFFGV
jgi:xylose isomerase